MERSTTITIRDLDPEDVDALKREAATRAVSLNRLVGDLVHRRARTARNRALLRAATKACPTEHSPADGIDTVTDVRAVRDEHDARATRIAESWDAR